MKIQPFYAFLDGIKRKLKHATSAIIGLTSRKVIEKYEYQDGGLCEFVMITVNNPDVQIKLRFDEDHWEWTPQQLQDYGLTEPNPYGLWLGQYDNVNDYYTVMFVPENMLSFSKELILETFYALSSYNIVQYEIIVYEIINQGEFLSSIQDLNISAERSVSSRRRISPPRVVTPPKREKREWDWRRDR